MSAFYNRIAKTAIRLLTKYGKDCTFRSLVSVPNVNPSKPPIVSQSDNIYKAVFTKYKSEEIDGIRILTSDMKVLVQGNIDPSFKINGQIIDPTGQVWKVVGLEPVIPGPICVLFKVQVRV